MTTPRRPRPQPASDAIIWTPEEVAAALATAVTEVERLRERGALRAVKIGRAWRYRPADVRAYVDGLAGAGTATSEPAIYRYRRGKAG